MDLLGSIMNSMDKPPAASDKQKALVKSQLQVNLYCQSLYNYFLLTK